MTNETINQGDLNIEAQTTGHIAETIVDTMQDSDLSLDDREGVVILYLEELLKRGRIYDIMRQQIEDTAACRLEGACDEIRTIVGKSRETLKTVLKIEKETAPAMFPW